MLYSPIYYIPLYYTPVLFQPRPTGPPQAGRSPAMRPRPFLAQAPPPRSSLPADWRTLRGACRGAGLARGYLRRRGRRCFLYSRWEPELRGGVGECREGWRDRVPRSCRAAAPSYVAGFVPAPARPGGEEPGMPGARSRRRAGPCSVSPGLFGLGARRHRGCPRRKAAPASPLLSLSSLSLSLPVSPPPALSLGSLPCPASFLPVPRLSPTWGLRGARPGAAKLCKETRV